MVIALMAFPLTFSRERGPDEGIDAHKLQLNVVRLERNPLSILNLLDHQWKFLEEMEKQF